MVFSRQMLIPNLHEDPILKSMFLFILFSQILDLWISTYVLFYGISSFTDKIKHQREIQYQ